MISGLMIAIGVMANLISKQRIGRTQPAWFDVEHATATVTSHFNIEWQGNKGYLMRYLEAVKALEEDTTTQDPLKYFRAIFNNTFPTKTNYIYMYMRANDTPEALLESLGFAKDDIPRLLEMTRTSPETRREYLRLFKEKLLEWSAEELEQHMIKRNTGAVIVPQSREKFLASEQGRIVSKLPAVEVLPQPKPAGARTGAWAPTPWKPLSDPKKGLLHGIKYLELTRILMGPRIGCVLGMFNGTGIKVSSPALEGV